MANKSVPRQKYHRHDTADHVRRQKTEMTSSRGLSLEIRHQPFHAGRGNSPANEIDFFQMSLLTENITFKQSFN